MIGNLHKWLALRLAVVWLVLSLLIGGIVHHLGNVHMDDHIMNMAKAEVTGHKEALVSYLKSPSAPALSVLNSRVETTLARDNFISVELYDASGAKITEAFEPDAREVDKKLSEHDNRFTQQNEVVCYKMTLSGETYLRVFAPIFDGAGVKVGYLEGIYRVPGEIVAQIQRQTLWSLILVVAAILVTGLALYPLIIRLNRSLVAHSRNLALTNVGMLTVLGSAIAKRDSDTNIHNYRVALYSVWMGERLGLSPEAMQGLIKGAFLHDLGKIAISDAVLHKPGKLTADEFDVMKTHVQHGVDIVRGHDWLQDALNVVNCHHERFDGGGYPAGLRCEDIPLDARIFAVVDVFDALTSERPYKKAFSFGAAVEIIRESLGSHFDPDVAEVFLSNAAVLHAEICGEDERILYGRLATCIGKYF